MQIKEIKLQRLGNANTISLNIKGNLASEENYQQIELFKKLFQVGIGFANLTLNKPETIKRIVFPTRDQWLELKQRVMQKIGTAEGDEIDNYIREQAGVNRIDTLTAREVQDLINRFSK